MGVRPGFHKFIKCVYGDEDETFPKFRKALETEVNYPQVGDDIVKQHNEKTVETMMEQVDTFLKMCKTADERKIKQWEECDTRGCQSKQGRYHFNGYQNGEIRCRKCMGLHKILP